MSSTRQKKRAAQTAGSHEPTLDLNAVFLSNAITASSMTATTLSEKATPRGRFPHIRRAGDFLFVRVPVRGARTTASPALGGHGGATRLDIRVQTRAVIENIRDIPAAEGATLANCVEITSYLVDMNDFAGYNEVWAEYFDQNGPTRTTVAVHQLPHPHLRIEMKAVAYKPR